MAISEETFFLDPASDATLQAQIQRMVAGGILSGRFRVGERLPSSRRLAAHLGVSRITVTLAYTELLSDDYITSRGRSGYFVSDSAPEPPDFVPEPSTDTVDWGRLLAHRPPPSPAVWKPMDWRSYRYPFIYGQTDESLFDTANWRLCAVQALGRRDFEALTTDYYDADDPKLIDFLTRQTLPRRGIVADPSEVLLTLGAQNALWLAAQVLLTQRRHATIEDPGYPALRSILMQSRCTLSAVPLDQDGLNPDDLPAGTDVVFTTPSHQCPTTATMPLERRQALLARATRDDFVVVEDDYEFEMSFLKPASPALKSLDRDGRVIHVGSFSKSLFPGLRLGYLVGPAPFIAAARELRASVLRHPPGHIQRTAAYFLSLGHYDAHVRRLGRAYHGRRTVMESAIAEAGLEIAGSHAAGGSAFWMRAPDGVDTAELAQDLRSDSVLIEPGAEFFHGSAPPRHFYRLAYSSTPSDRIAEGIALIGARIGRSR